MKKDQQQKENREVLLNSIISINNYLFKKIKDQYSNLTSTQIHTILLLKLNYTYSEIRTILDIPEKSINGVFALIKEIEYKLP